MVREHASESTRHYRRQLDMLASQGNELADWFRWRLDQAANPDQERRRQRADVRQQVANLARVGKILNDALCRPRED